MKGVGWECLCVGVCVGGGGVCVCVFQNFSGSLTYSLPIIYIFVKYTITTEKYIAITNT